MLASLGFDVAVRLAEMKGHSISEKKRFLPKNKLNLWKVYYTVISLVSIPISSEDFENLLVIDTNNRK